MTVNEYQKLAARTIDKNMGFKAMEDHALHGMVSEVGEMHSVYQKFYQGHIFDRDHIKEELGDLLWFIAEYCTSMDWNLEDVMQDNIKKLKARYPKGFDPERSLHRAENEEKKDETEQESPTKLTGFLKKRFMDVR